MLLTTTIALLFLAPPHKKLCISFLQLFLTKLVLNICDSGCPACTHFLAIFLGAGPPNLPPPPKKTCSFKAKVPQPHTPVLQSSSPPILLLAVSSHKPFKETLWVPK